MGRKAMELYENSDDVQLCLKIMFPYFFKNISSLFC